MSAARDVPPALTEAEWAACDVGSESGLTLHDGRLWNSSDGQPIDNPAGVMALANAALPDGDPQKITRSMVADLNFCVGLAFFVVPRTPTVAGALPAGAEYVARAHRALQVLRALLPPEGT